MKFTWFHLMPYRFLPEDFKEKYHSVWVDIPRDLYDPKVGHRLYNDYLDQLEYADSMGFDGLGVNEHHQNAYGLMPSPNIMAGAPTAPPPPPHPQRQPGRARQFDRALQSADSRRRGIRDARRYLGRTPDRRLPGRHLDGYQLLLRRSSRDDSREVLRGSRPDHQGVGGQGRLLVQRQIHQAALREPVAEAAAAAASTDLDSGRRLGRDLRLLRRSRLPVQLPFLLRVYRGQESFRR